MVPLLPIVVGVVCFLVGLGAGKVKFVGPAGAEGNPEEYLGDPCGVLMLSGSFHEGNLQDLTDDQLILEVGDQEFLDLPLKKIKRLEVYAN